MKRGLEAAAVLVLFLAGAAFRYKLVSHWVFAGSDSYGYVKIADELSVRHHFALAPPPAPLYWARLPLYPLFIAAVGGNTTLGNIQWLRIEYAQLIVDLCGSGLLAWAVARRLAGKLAGLLALALVMLYPITALFVATALTETLAMTLTLAAIAPLVLMTSHWRFFFSGAVVGIATLLRADSILLAVAPAVAILSQPDHRLRAGWLVLAGFALAFAPWPVRNLMQFGKPHLFGAHLSRFSQPVDHSSGYWNWLRTWGKDWVAFSTPQACFYDSDCALSAADLSAYGAFRHADDSTAVAQLLARRAAKGSAQEISDGFAALAQARIRRQPLRTLLWLPLQRASHMWVSLHDEVLQNPDWIPWPKVMRQLRKSFGLLSGILVFALLLSAAALLLQKNTRHAARLLVVPIAVRTLFLGWSGYCMPRYATEAMVLGFVLIAWFIASVPLIAGAPGSRR